MIPNQAENNAATLAAQEALTAAANAQFIADAAVIIQNLTAQGKYQTFLTHTEHVSFQYITAYFQNLGYTVVGPQCPFWENGYYYGQYWTPWTPWFAQRQICGCREKCKIFISWKSPGGGGASYGPCPWPGC